MCKLTLKMQLTLQARDSWGFTPLHRAAYNGQRDVVEFLINQGSDPNATNNFGLTPLKRAALCGYKETVKLLEQVTQWNS